MAKSFKDMTPTERQQWLASEAKVGRITNAERSDVIGRIVSALKENGPMTTRELADALLYRSHESLTTWTNRKENQAKMQKAGVLKHVSPDDGKTRIFLLVSHVEEVDAPARRLPGFPSQQREAV